MKHIDMLAKQTSIFWVWVALTVAFVGLTYFNFSLATGETPAINFAWGPNAPDMIDPDSGQSLSEKIDEFVKAFNKSAADQSKQAKGGAWISALGNAIGAATSAFAARAEWRNR